MNAVAVDLMQAAGGTVESGFSGFVHGVSLVDLLQIFHYSRRTLTLHIEPNAAIHVVDGEIVHARSGELEGELAISTLLERASGKIRTAGAEVVPTTIQRPFNFLLLDALRGMDESHRDEVPDIWPEESGEFSKDLLSPPHSLLPSVPAAGNQLLASACMQLAERVENTCAVALLDLKERKLVAQCGAVNRKLLETESLAAFERAEVGTFERALSKAGQLDQTRLPEAWLDEVRYIGESGVFFGKMLSSRSLGLVLCARGNDAPGLAWAELRQSVRMVERILP